ncbi:hypothetical protein INR49_030836, partial [Caranx melampygus]
MGRRRKQKASRRSARPGSYEEDRGLADRHKKVQEVHREDNVRRVGLGTSVHPPCHSTPRTLDCAKHCSNT